MSFYEQYFPLVLFMKLYKVVIFEPTPTTEILNCDPQMKVRKRWFKFWSLKMLRATWLQLFLVLCLFWCFIYFYEVHILNVSFYMHDILTKFGYTWQPSSLRGLFSNNVLYPLKVFFSGTATVSERTQVTYILISGSFPSEEENDNKQKIVVISLSKWKIKADRYDLVHRISVRCTTVGFQLRPL